MKAAAGSNAEMDHHLDGNVSTQRFSESWVKDIRYSQRPRAQIIAWGVYCCGQTSGARDRGKVLSSMLSNHRVTTKDLSASATAGAVQPELFSTSLRCFTRG